MKLTIIFPTLIQFVSSRPFNYPGNSYNTPQYLQNSEFQLIQSPIAICNDIKRMFGSDDPRYIMFCKNVSY